MDKKEALNKAYASIVDKWDRCLLDATLELNEMKASIEGGDESSFMLRKGEFLRVVSFFQGDILKSDCCPYCLELGFDGNTTKCSKCEYGKVKGVCSNSGYASKWGNLVNKIDEVLNAIADYANHCPKMEKKRFLKLGNFEFDGDNIKFQIVEQSHRGDEFGPENYIFEASNGILLESIASPELVEGCKMFCRGSDACLDNIFITTDPITFARILEAVKEYNEA